MGTLLAACLLALPAPALQKEATDGKAFEELLLRYAGHGWSGAVLVARNGEALHAAGYGFADFESNRVNEPSTLFEIASITKAFTATAVVRLAQQGKLALDDSIALHLPGVPAHSRAITLRHLLSHTSGMPRDNADGRGEDLAQATLAYLGNGPRGKPGAKWEYWNGGYALLAGVIERASGRSYTEYLEQELFAPAHMIATGFTGDTDLDEARAARGASSQGPPRTAIEHPYGSFGYQYRGMGGIVTSVLDLLAWDRALASGALLDEAHARELFEPVASGYALGWKIDRSANGSARQSHGGTVRGFVSEFRRFPAENACVAVLCNSDGVDARAIAENVECLLFGRPLASPPPKYEGPSRAELEACAGTFGCAAGKLVVRAAPGVLIAGLEGDALLVKAGASVAPDWKADVDELTERAVAIVEGIARGDAGLLREHMAKRIPPTWPDTMLRSIWPAHLERHGAFASVRAVGRLARGERVAVLVELQHQEGPARALIEFSSAGLEKLDWQGPWFLASARLEPSRKNAFRLDLGKDARELEFDAARNTVKLAGLKLVRE